jgi:hypothetical protein
VAVAPDGTATAVWFRSNGPNTIVQASTRPPRGAFGSPVDLSAVGGSGVDPQVAVAQDGTATVVWQRQVGFVSIVQASTRPPGGAFGSPVDLSAAGGNARSAQLGIAKDGTTTVTWQLSGALDRIVQASTRPPGGAFGSPVDLSAAGELSDSSDVAVAPDGTTTVIWRNKDLTDTVVQASTRPPGGTFGSPIDVSAAGVDVDDEVRVAVAADGTTTVIWTDNTLARTRTRPPGGAFGPVVDMSTVGESANDAEVAVAPDGTTAAIWYRSDGADDRAQVSTRPPGGAFGSPIHLSAVGGGSDDPQVTVAPDGTATAVWRRSDGANFITQAAFTASPPLPPVTPPAPAPAPPLAVVSPKPAFATLVSLPANKKCVSRRSFRIRLRQPRGTQIRSAVVRLNGKKVATRSGKRVTAPVDLRGLPSGRFKVSITVTLADGRTVSGARSYRTCVPKRRR